MRFLLILCFVIFYAFDVPVCNAQQKLTDSVVIAPPATIKKDSSKITPRKFKEDAIQQYRQQKEFNYEDTAKSTWWDRLWEWIWRLIQDIFSGSPKAKPTGLSPWVYKVFKYLIITAAIAAVVFVVYKIFGLDLKFLTGKSKTVDVPYEESLENIHEINFDEQLDKAIADGNYRVAVRLLYLSTLKKLSDAELISWMPDKTNQAYVAEMQNEQYKAAFAQLTYRFEYVWYGEFFIDKESFGPIREAFYQFNQQLS